MVSKKKLKFNIKRLLNFTKVFFSKKQGVVGVAIILAFLLIAICAPLLTPYNQLGVRPNAPIHQGVSSPWAKPSWARYLPTWLGGGPELSENMIAVKNPLEQGWRYKILSDLTNGQLKIEPNYYVNYPNSSDGCIAVTYKRNPNTQPEGRVKVQVESEFHWPYSGPPGELSGSVTLLVNGTSATHLYVPVEAWVYLERLSDGKKWYLWPPPSKLKGEFGHNIEWVPSGTQGVVVPKGYEVNETVINPYSHPPDEYSGEVYISKPCDGDMSGWITTKQSTIDSSGRNFIKREGLYGLPNERLDLRTMVSGEGNYTYGVEIVFMDEEIYPSNLTLTGKITLMGIIKLENNETVYELPVNLNTHQILRLPPLIKDGEYDVSIKESRFRVYEKEIEISGKLKVYVPNHADPVVFPVSFSIPNQYGIQELVTGSVSFKDVKAKTEVIEPETIETTVYIDHLSLRFFGTCWGLLGTDQYGRDLFSQLIYGTWVSLYVGTLSSVCSVVIGLVVGLVAGYSGRAVDEILMRFADMLLVIPFLPLLIVLMAVLGAKIENLIVLMGLLGWMGFARQVRSQVLSLRERPFVEAAKAAGAGRGHILMRHILPNVMGLVYVTLATSVPSAIVSEAALSWLGFFDPWRMSWGRMLHDAQQYGLSTYAWWWVIPPGLCIAALAFSFILLGFALDEVLNPKLRIRR